MNPEKNSRWHGPWRGRRKVFLWLALVAAAAYLILACFALSSPGPNTFSNVIGGPMIAAICVAVAAAGVVAFFRWICHWRNLRRFLLTLACLVTAVALFLTEESWRGKRAWEKHKHEWEAKGERFTLMELAPPPVPDEENFALTPLLKPLLDYERTPSGIKWRDRDAFDHVQQLRPDLKSQQSGEDRTSPALGNLQTGRLADLESWRSFYRGNTNYPQPEASGTAAADILVALGRFNAELAELEEAAATRPRVRFPIEYDHQPSWGILLPHLAHIKGLGRLVQLRTTAELEAGKTKEAFQDLKLGFRLSDSIHDEPLLIDHLVRLATLAQHLQSVREGLARQSWSDAQLIELEQYLASLDILGEYRLAMRGERALSVGGLDYYRRRGLTMPPLDYVSATAEQRRPIGRFICRFLGGFYYQNMLNLSEMQQKFIIEAVDEKRHRVFPEKDAQCDAELKALRARSFSPFTAFAKLLLPALQGAMAKSAQAQFLVDAARIACALERYRLTEGRLPETLQELAPRFISDVPSDVIDGQPLRYRQTTAGGYLVYSIGWNQIDDQGHVIGPAEQEPPLDAKIQEDWVWTLSNLASE